MRKLLQLSLVVLLCTCFMQMNEARADPVLDPIGDTFGFGDVLLDITSAQSCPI